MRRVTIRVPAARVEEAFDVLLPLLPSGVHRRDHGDAVELVALCTEDEARAVPASLGELTDETADDLAVELDRLRPAIDIGGRILIRPAAAPPPPPGVADVVIAARSFGFGTGAHPTTRLCLRLLLDLEPGGSFADLGCGAGAVLIAAARLGWSPVHGVDHSALALRDARANCEANGVIADLRGANLLEGDLPEVGTAVANISEADVHTALATAPLKTLIVSGLRTDEIDPVLRRYAAAGFTAADHRREAEWSAALLRR